MMHLRSTAEILKTLTDEVIASSVFPLFPEGFKRDNHTYKEIFHIYT